MAALAPLLAGAHLLACRPDEAALEGTQAAAEPAGLFRHFESLRAAENAPGPTSVAEAEQGQTLFLELGCGACHTVRGTAATGVIGPDLTHVGSRASIGAGALENTVAGFKLWVTQPDLVKPGVHMPSFNMPTPGEVHALAVYLESLQ